MLCDAIRDATRDGHVQAFLSEGMGIRPLHREMLRTRIAGALYIAEGTVKAHMHQPFGKPVARNRTEAVAKGRDLSLIP